MSEALNEVLSEDYKSTPKTQEEQRYISLGWQILELKYVYYYAGVLHPDWEHLRLVSDQDYDKLEAEYRELAKKQGLRPTTDVVGFPDNKPSGRLVMQKLSKPREEKARLFLLEELEILLF